MSAHEKNAKHRKPLTEDDFKRINKSYQEGNTVLMKRPVSKCYECKTGVLRILKYIGDIDEVSEWEYTCDNCGSQLYG